MYTAHRSPTCTTTTCKDRLLTKSAATTLKSSSLSRIQQSMASVGAASSHLAIEFPELLRRKAVGSPLESVAEGSTTPTTTTTTNRESMAPEQELTLVALRLAILEKAASGLGVMAFVWATVVLLGGFVSNISSLDFWVVSCLILTEGTRVFSRSHELEWQHAAAASIKVNSTRSNLYTTGSSVLQSAFSVLMIHKPPDIAAAAAAAAAAATAVHIQSVPPTPPLSASPTKKSPEQEQIRRTWSWSTVPFMPYSNYFSARHISFLLHLLQLGSAMLTVGLSAARLAAHKYDTGRPAGANQIAGLSIFYTMSLLEASIFLVERAYWEYSINWRKLLVQVTEKAQLGENLRVTIKQFFYDVYSQCLKGSIFDGLEQDLVSYSIDKIRDSSNKEQLGGALMLSAFISQDTFLEDTLRKIGTSSGVTERLLEMLTWKNEHEKEIRRAAAKVLCQLVVQNHNSSRVMATAGALEAIVGLLLEKDTLERDSATGALLSNELKLHGLRMLHNLAMDDKNCFQIGSTRGILEILVSNIEVKDIREVDCLDELNQVKIFKKSLQLLGRLVSVSGDHGKTLRQEIVQIVFTLRNLRDVIRYGETHPACRELAVDIITHLALEEPIKESMGATGSMLSTLLTLFFDEVADERSLYFRLRVKAGKALHMLLVNSRRNSSRIRSYGKPVNKLVELLHHNHVLISVCAAKILHSLSASLDADEKQQVLRSMPWILSTLPSVQPKQLEVNLGLAASIFPLLDDKELSSLLSNPDKNLSLVVKIIGLTSHPSPSLHMHLIRRHTVELALVLMQRSDYFRRLFRDQDIADRLRAMQETISDMENFLTFCGTMGVGRHPRSMEELIDAAVQAAQEP